jgi:hypothetical protein
MSEQDKRSNASLVQAPCQDLALATARNSLVSRGIADLTNHDSDRNLSKTSFQNLLRLATMMTLEYAREHISSEIPANVRYKLYPNESYDGGSLRGDVTLYPDDTLPEGGFHGPLTIADAISFLWRNGKIPQWIDLTVDSVLADLTIIKLRCCGRFTATAEYLYYSDEGLGPFNPGGRPWPMDWKKFEGAGKFDLTWRCFCK